MPNRAYSAYTTSCAVLVVLLRPVLLLTLCFWRSSEERAALISLRLSLEAAVK
jgi:hypothetical protein